MDTLIDIRYNDIIAKSNRVRELLKGVKSPDNTIVGARFTDAEPGLENHIITHYVEFSAIDSTIKKLRFARRFLVEKLDGRADKKNFNKPGSAISYNGYEYKETKIRDIIIDCSVVDYFDIPGVANIDIKESMLVTFYQTELRVSEVLEKIGLTEPYYRYSVYGNNSIAVDTTSNSSTGQRYIHHKEKGTRVLLFVREFKSDRISNGTAAYTYLGTANYVKHEGERPMNITWKLDHPIPAKDLKKTNKLVVG